MLAIVGVLVALASIGCGSRLRGQPLGTAPGSTLQSTWQDPRGNGVLRPGPPEPLRSRVELAPAAPLGAELARFAQLTDAHVADEESPARAELLDRLGAPFNSTFRPQEALAGQVLAGAVRAVNSLRPQGVVVTGDLADNAQANELAEALSVLRGGRIHPDSGRPGYDGPQAAGGADPLFYRPDVDAPRHPGLMERAQQPFASPGLRAPWHALPGNHDLLVEGELASSVATEALAVGGRRLIDVDPALSVPQGEAGLSRAGVDRVLSRGLPGRSVATPADRRRHELTSGQVLAMLRSASGHGGSGPYLDEAFDIGPRVRAIALDLVRRDQGSRGLVRPAQVAFLRAALRGAAQRWILVFTHQPLIDAQGAGPALDLLDRDPRVIAAIAGDTHRNRISARRSPAGGWWSITTSSLIDWPQQARAFRLVHAGTGVALETWMLDHPRDGGLGDISRELAYLDVQGGRPQGFAGRPEDRNAILFHR